MRLRVIQLMDSMENREGGDNITLRASRQLQRQSYDGKSDHEKSKLKKALVPPETNRQGSLKFIHELDHSKTWDNIVRTVWVAVHIVFTRGFFCVNSS